MSKQQTKFPTYQEIMDGAIKLTKKYPIGFLVKGIPVELINSSLHANLEKVKEANTYDAAERLINDLLTAAGSGTLTQHIPNLKDRKELYELMCMYRRRLLAELCPENKDYALPASI